MEKNNTIMISFFKINLNISIAKLAKLITILALILYLSLTKNSSSINYTIPKTTFNLEIKSEIGSECDANSGKNCIFNFTKHLLKTTNETYSCNSYNCIKENCTEYGCDKYEAEDLINFEDVDLKMLAGDSKDNFFYYSMACDKDQKNGEEYCLDFKDKTADIYYRCIHNQKLNYTNNSQANIKTTQYCNSLLQNRATKNLDITNPYKKNNSFDKKFIIFYSNIYPRNEESQPLAPINLNDISKKETNLFSLLNIITRMGLYLDIKENETRLIYTIKSFDDPDDTKNESGFYISESSNSNAWLYLKSDYINLLNKDYGTTNKEKLLLHLLRTIDETDKKDLLLQIKQKLSANDNKKYPFILRRIQKNPFPYQYSQNIFYSDQNEICVFKKNDKNKKNPLSCAKLEKPKLCPAIIIRSNKIISATSFLIENSYQNNFKNSTNQFATFSTAPAEVEAIGICDYGDNLIINNYQSPKMKCLSNGKWDLNSFKNSCIKQQCPPIYITQDPTNATDETILLQGSNTDGTYDNNYKPEKYGYAVWGKEDIGEGISAKACIAGYEPEGQLPTMSCNQYGQWNFEISNPCKRIKCQKNEGRNIFQRRCASPSINKLNINDDTDYNSNDYGRNRDNVDCNPNNEESELNIDKNIWLDTIATSAKCINNNYDMPTALYDEGEEVKPTAYCDHKGNWEFENLCTKSCENIVTDNRLEQIINNDLLTTDPYRSSSFTNYPNPYDKNNGFVRWIREADSSPDVPTVDIDTSNSYILGTQSMQAKIEDERVIDGLLRKLKIKNSTAPTCVENFTCTIIAPGDPPIVKVENRQTPQSNADCNGGWSITSRTTTYNIEASIQYSSTESEGSCENDKNYYDNSNRVKRACKPIANSLFKGNQDSVSYINPTSIKIKDETACDETLCCGPISSCNHCKQSEAMNEVKNEIEQKESSNLPNKKWSKVENPCRYSCPAEEKTYITNITIPWPKVKFGKTLSINNEGANECRQMTADLFYNGRDNGCYNIARECSNEGWKDVGLCNINSIKNIQSIQTGIYDKLSTIENNASGKCLYKNENTVNISCANPNDIDTSYLNLSATNCQKPNHEIAIKNQEIKYTFQEGDSFAVAKANTNEYIFTCSEICAIKFSNNLQNANISYQNAEKYKNEIYNEAINWKCKIKNEDNELITGFYHGNKNYVSKDTSSSPKLNIYYARPRIDSKYFITNSAYKHYLESDKENNEKINYCWRIKN